MSAIALSSVACQSAAPTEGEETAIDGQGKPTDVDGDGGLACADKEALPCDDVVVWLACYSREEIEDHFCASCHGEPACPEKDTKLSSELTSRQSLAGFRCEEYEYAIAAIKTWYGQPVDELQWAAFLESQPWYRDGHAEDLSVVAQQNMEELQRARSECMTSYEVNAEDREFVRSWFDELAATGKPIEAPEHYVDFAEATFEEFSNFVVGLQTVGDGFEINRRTPIAVDARGGRIALRDDQSSRTQGPRYARVIRVQPSLSAMMSCTAPGRCEGYETLIFYLDDEGQLVAQGVTAAG